jgi:hypothetical protein
MNARRYCGTRSRDAAFEGIRPRMGTPLLRMGAWTWVVTFAALSCAAPVELLPNGGGEKINERNIPTYFGVQNAGEISSSPLPRTGDRAVRLIARPHEWKFSIFVTPNVNSFPQDDVVQIKVANGGVYRASVWVRGRGVFRLGVQQWPSILGSVMGDPVALTKQWQQVQLEYRVEKPEVKGVNLQFRLDGDNAIADIDDASLTFDGDENPGIEHFQRVPERDLTFRLDGRQLRSVEVFANGKPVPVKNGLGSVTIREGLVALAIRTAPSGMNAGVRLRIEGHPETDGRWRATSRAGDQWLEVGADDREWPTVSSDDDGFMWSSDGRSSARTQRDDVCFRQVLLWNETHCGPNRCILPLAREWGISRGGFENLTLALYSPLASSLRDFEFVLDVPAGFTVFGKSGDYYTRYVLNQKPDRLIEEQHPRVGQRATRYRFSHPPSHVRGDDAADGIQTQYSVIPVGLAADYAANTTVFRYHRRANGNFTELEQRIPVRVLPPVNGRQPKKFMISAYVGMPLGYSTLSPEHLRALVWQAAAAGWTHCSVSVSSPGSDTWGKEWFTYQKAYLEMCRQHGIQAILWPWHSFPITGSLLEPSEPKLLLDWVEATPGAKARYFKDTPTWSRADANMFCPSYVSGEGAEQFRQIVADVWSGMIKQMGGTDIIWTDDERTIFTANGAGSYCFCDRCKTEFRAFAKLSTDADVTDASLFTTHNHQWRLFWAHLWFGRVHGELRKVANSLGKRYMVYTWNGSDDLWRELKGNLDIAFPGMPGSNVMTGNQQKAVDDSMAFYRREVGVPIVQGQTFALLGAGHQKNAWALQQVISRDGFVDAKSWKSQLLRLAATLQGGVDLGESTIDYRAGSYYWIGEATRIIAEFEDLFVEGVRADNLAVSSQISYPNLLVLKKEDERLVLLFNEGDTDLEVKLENVDLAENQRARVFEHDEWVDARELTVTVPSRDALVIHLR